MRALAAEAKPQLNRKGAEVQRRAIEGKVRKGVPLRESEKGRGWEVGEGRGEEIPGTKTQTSEKFQVPIAGRRPATLLSARTQACLVFQQSK